ncbi:fibronectin type III domain-containing protein [Streptomyces longisporoflavus]|uniref:fibronectin type III domain-containing protein n=1 Tax=Streptomyces longisporoflavus TaxID=28044 RepID=UPI00167E2819|nr:fibronectin type III domain-containing protein [Streptomyces longisporoflavus]
MSRRPHPRPAAVASAAAVVILALGISGTAHAAAPTAAPSSARHISDDPDQPDNPLYDAPESLNAQSGREAVSLSWGSLSAATAYEVYRAEAEGTEPDEVGPYKLLATVPESSYVDSDADPDVEYAYKVRALDDAGHVSPYTDPVRGTRDTVAPLSPQDLTLAREDERGVTLTWRSGNSDAVKYVLYRFESPNSAYTKVGSTTSLTFRDTKGEPGRQYIYEVRGVDAAGNESRGSNWEYGTKTVTEATVPTAPTVQGGELVGRRLALRWSQSAYVPVSSYTVYRSKTSPVDITDAANRVGTTTRTEYTGTVGESEGERDYHYAVVATTPHGVSSAASASVKPTYSEPQPPRATQFYEVAPGAGSVRLQWYAAPYGSGEAPVAGYRVYRSAEPGVTRENAQFTHVTSSTEYVDRGLTAGTKYYYAVATVDEDGEESALSPEASATPTG